MKLTLVLVTVACIALSSLSGLASGDGMPVTTITVHRSLRENRQIAMVDVGNDGNETISLFISVASLEPGNDVTILVPLRTSPNTVGVARTNDSEFESSHHMGMLFGMDRKADSAADGALKSYEEAAGSLATLAVIPMGMYFMVSGYMAGGGGSPYQTIYVDDCLSASLFSFGNTSSVNETFAQLGVEVPADTQKIIDDYGSYNAAVINVKTRPPIDETNYSSFQRAYPDVLRSFKEFVASHPMIDISVMGYGNIDADYFQEEHYGYYNLIFNDEELQVLLSRFSYSDSDYWQMFQQIILSTYGLAPSEGFALEVNLPLDDGKAFFPLGTSPSWSGQGSVKVAFKTGDGKGLDFTGADGTLVWKGSRYYLFDYGSESPSYDLDAKVVNAGMNEWAADRKNDFAFWVSDNGATIGWVGALATMWSIWLAVSVVFTIKGRVLRNERRAFAITMASGAMLATIVFSFLGGLFFCFIMLALASKRSAIEGQALQKELRDIRIERLADALGHREALRAHEVDDGSERLVR